MFTQSELKNRKKIGIFLRRTDFGFLREIDFMQIFLKIVHFFKELNSNKPIVQKIYFLGILHTQLLDHPKAKYITQTLKNYLLAYQKKI